MRQAGIWLVISGVFLMGGCSVVSGRRLQQEWQSLPRLTCDQLVQNGAGGHTFIQLADVHLSAGGFAFQRFEHDLELYVPIYPAHLGQEPPPQQLRLVLEILDDRDRKRLLGQPHIGELICQVDRSVSQIDPAIGTALEQRYPGLAWQQCRLVSVGLHEPTLVKIRQSWQFAVISFLLGGSLLGWRLWLRPTTLLDQHVPGPATPIPSGKPQLAMFHEVQRPDWRKRFWRSFWIVLAVGFLGSSILWHDESWSPAITVLLTLMVWIVPAVLVWAVHYVTRMETRVSAEGVVVAMTFHGTMRIDPLNIQTVSVRPFDPDAPGINHADDDVDKVFWAAGGQVVELGLRDGGRVRIGSQRADELMAAISTWLMPEKSRSSS